MDSFFIPSENDFRRWIREGIREYFENPVAKPPSHAESPDQETLLSRKEIAGIFRISLVTLHGWMNRGLPCHKQGGRVYFFRSEVMEYLKENGGRYLKISADQKILHIRNSEK